jgi:hypothetical protein
MTATTHQTERKTNRDLAQVLEPLVSYICAADRPQEALLSAVAALRNSVQETNRAAWTHFLGVRGDSLALV